MWVAGGRVRKYFKYFLRHESAIDKEAILDKLSPQLRSHLAKYLIDQVVLDCGLFIKLNDIAKARLVSILKPVSWAEADVLVRYFRLRAPLATQSL